jgi:hypothetical protein
MGMAKLQRENKVRNFMFMDVIENLVLGKTSGLNKGNIFCTGLTATVRLLS